MHPQRSAGVLAIGLLCCLGACRTTHPPDGSTLVLGSGGDPGALNPAVTTSGNTHAVTDHIFNGLVGLDEAFNPVPELAERWTVEDGGVTWRFELRRGVQWHDGAPFTSADVKFTFEEALLKYHSRTRAGLEGVIAGIDTPDEHTVVFRLTRPYGPLLQRLDVGEASIIPRHLYAGQDLLNGEAARRPVGTGPFRFVSHTPGDKLVLESNTSYFRAGVPGLARVVFRAFPNPSTAVAALETGAIDYVGTVPGPDAERLRRTPGVAVVAATAGPGGSICQDVLIPNLTRAPFDDLRVRRAFAHAIDRALIADRVYWGQGRPATGPISHLLAWAYTPAVRQYPYDPAKAEHLLDAAGLKRGSGGSRVNVTFTHAAGHQRLAHVLRELLKRVGVTLDLQTLDFNAAVERVYVRKAFDLGLASYCNGADPDIGVRRVYVSSNIGPLPFSNGAGYRNPRIDHLFEEAARAAEREVRRRHYVEIQEILAEDVPYFWLIDSGGLRAHRTTFGGFRMWTGAFLETVTAAPLAAP